MTNNASGGSSSRSSAPFSPSLTSGIPPTPNRITGPNSGGSAGLNALGGLGGSGLGGLGPGLGLGQGGSNPESTNPNELLTLPGNSNPINTTEAQMAASVRERARQAQIRIAQQGMGGGMGNMGGMGGITGMGGGMGGMGGSIGMGNMGNMGSLGGGMSGMGNMGGGMGGMGNMSGMGGNMGQGMAGMQQQGTGMQRQMSPGHGGGGGPQGQGPQGQGQGPMMGGGNAIAGPSNLGLGIGGGQGLGPGQGGGGGVGGLNQAQLQQAFQILNTPGHPLLQYLIKTVPGFENMPLQQQVQKMMMSRVSSFFFPGSCCGTCFFASIPLQKRKARCLQTFFFPLPFLDGFPEQTRPTTAATANGSSHEPCSRRYGQYAAVASVDAARC